jgi:hypothetical protein
MVRHMGLGSDTEDWSVPVSLALRGFRAFAV